MHNNSEFNNISLSHSEAVIQLMSFRCIAICQLSFSDYFCEGLRLLFSRQIPAIYILVVRTCTENLGFLSYTDYSKTAIRNPRDSCQSLVIPAKAGIQVR